MTALNYAAIQHAAMIDSMLSALTRTSDAALAAKFYTVAELKEYAGHAGVAAYGSRQDIILRIQRKLRGRDNE